MSGWIALVMLIGLSLAGLWLMRVRGALLQLGAAALLVGGAGYALQGRPALPEVPGKAGAARVLVQLTGARHAFFGNFTADEHWLIISESMARRGNSADAVGVLRSAVRAHPRDAQLWVGLGNALVDHAGVLTPAGELAFRRAAELAPGHPAPAFFLGLALARSGDRRAALVLWRQILAEAPAETGWRPIVEDGIAALDRS